MASDKLDLRRDGPILSCLGAFLSFFVYFSQNSMKKFYFSQIRKNEKKLGKRRF